MWFIHCGVGKKVINGIKRLVVLCDDLLILDRKGLEKERNYAIAFKILKEKTSFDVKCIEKWHNAPFPI